MKLLTDSYSSQAVRARMYGWLAWIFLGSITFLSAQNPGDPPPGIPAKPDSWINDYADVLTMFEEQGLNKKLSQLESETSTQIFVAIFNRIPENYALEDFTTRLFEQWRPGLAKENNGVLLTVFIEDRRLRIETGYGLEDVLTDAQAGTVIREYITPHFRAQDYYQGISSGLDVIISAVEGKFQIPVRRPRDRETISPLVIFILLFLLLLFISSIRRRSTTYSRRGARYSPWLFPPVSGGRSRGGWSSGGSRGWGSSGGGGFSGGFGGFSGGGGASGSW